MPAANSVGYYQSERSEHGVDVNRDFPNDQEKPSQCLRSRAARTFYSLFAKHHIQVALTMHAGAQQLCYPWGDFAHQRAERSRHRFLFDLGGEGKDGMMSLYQDRKFGPKNASTL